MKKILLFALLIVSANSFAQMAKNNLPKPGVISGKVIDKNTKENLPYVNIVVRDLAKKILTEKDIALLLIKGLSMKEISALRGSSDATVRQQSASVYKKSKLDNRNQLSSYFLEDLF